MDNPGKTALFVTVEAKFAAELHGELKRKGWLDTESKPHNSEDGRVGFPVVSGLDEGELRTHLTVPHAIIDGPFVARGPVDPHRRLERRSSMGFNPRHQHGRVGMSANKVGTLGIPCPPPA